MAAAVSMRSMRQFARKGAEVSGPTLVAPAAVVVVDLDSELPEIVLPSARGGGRYRSLLAVPRLDGRPIGAAVLVPPDTGRISVEKLSAALSDHPGPEPGSAMPSPSEDGDQQGPGPSVTVVVATCRNPDALERCLRSILSCDYERYEVVVVENRPGLAVTQRLVEERFADPRLRYTEARRPGLSCARNAGLAEASGELIALTDDDVVVDRGWLRHAVRAFARDESIGCVTGLILPLRLETRSQVLLDQFTSFGKGFQPRTFRLGAGRELDPLFPYTAGQIGSGANTFLRAEVARQVGGFDPNLGAGTLACGGEDLDFYIRVLQHHYDIVYEPGAILWHEHPDGARRLRRQVYRYGIGLTAMLTKQFVTGSERQHLLQCAPAGLRYAVSPTSRKNARKAADRPRLLDALEGVGMAVGPGAYMASRAASKWRARR
jgi:GT2 family glycosyltransferase